MTPSPDNQQFICEQKKKSVRIFRTFTIYVVFCFSNQDLTFYGNRPGLTTSNDSLQKSGNNLNTSFNVSSSHLSGSRFIMCWVILLASKIGSKDYKFNRFGCILIYLDYKIFYTEGLQKSTIC